MTNSPTDEPETSTASACKDEPPATLVGSRVVSGVQTAKTRVGSWVRHSRLYQWLTAEPDPAVIVIDLRETRTVGPVLRILDSGISRMAAAVDDSRAAAVARRGIAAVSAAPVRVGGVAIVTIGLLLAATGVIGDTSSRRVGIGIGVVLAGLVAMRDDRDWATLRATRPVAFMIAAFEPPEPPESSESNESSEPPEPPGSPDPSELPESSETPTRKRDAERADGPTEERREITPSGDTPDERTDE